MVKQVKGPLTLGDEAANTDYNQTMKDLMGQLVDTPEQVEKNELLAWGGGLTDPSGQGKLGDAVINAGATQSKYRQKDKELRAQYIPLIMQALATQAQAQAMQAGVSEDLSTMTPERALQLEQVNKGTWNAWKTVNEGEATPEGSFRQKWNPATKKMEYVRYLPKAGGPTQDVTTDGEVTGTRNIPGSATAAGQTAGATAFGKGVAENLTGTTPVLSGGAKGVAPSSVVNPIDAQKGFQAFETQPPARTGSPVAPVPPQGPPQGAAPTGPGQGTTGPAIAGPTPAAPRAGAQLPVRSASGAPPVMDVLAGRATDSSQNGLMRGAWSGTPQQIEETMARFPPQIREQMRASYANQQSGNNPPKDLDFQPKYDLAGGEPAAPVGTAPAAGGGVPGFIQQELSTGQQQNVENIKQSSASARKTYDDLIAREQSFGQEEMQIKQLESGLAGVGRTGPYTTAVRKNVANLLAAAGVEADEKYLTDYSKVENAIKTKVNAAILADKGVATEGDATRHEKTLVSLKEGTPQYNQYLLDTYKAVLERDKDKAAFFRRIYPKAERSPDGDTGKVARDWAARQPSLFSMPSMQKYDKK